MCGGHHRVPADRVHANAVPQADIVWLQHLSPPLIRSLHLLTRLRWLFFLHHMPSQLLLRRPDDTEMPRQISIRTRILKLCGLPMSARVLPIQRPRSVYTVPHRVMVPGQPHLTRSMCQRGNNRVCRCHITSIVRVPDANAWYNLHSVHELRDVHRQPLARICRISAAAGVGAHLCRHDPL